MTMSRRYRALIKAAADAKNPEFKDLWKRKLNELVQNSKEELTKSKDKMN
jgi:hypothetical protein